MLRFSDILTMEGAAAVLFYFMVYSFLGWLLENSYNFLIKRKFLKPNFLYGPFKPMYGFTPILLVYLISPETHWAIVLLLCFFVPTLVEYSSGVLIQKFFGRQYWDYTDTPLQFQGHICLPFSACWLVLSLICLILIHPAITHMYVYIDSIWIWMAALAGVYFLTDAVLSIRKHSLWRVPDNSFLS